MTGYHYTSTKNYESIKVEGLRLYPLTHPVIVAHPKVPKRGIWVYTSKPDSLSHYGCLIWQACTKETSRIVLLQVEYTYEDRLTPNGEHTVSISHDLTQDDDKVYHVKASATLLFRPVLPSSIRLVAQYDDVPRRQMTRSFGPGSKDAERLKRQAAITASSIPIAEISRYAL